MKQAYIYIYYHNNYPLYVGATFNPEKSNDIHKNLMIHDLPFYRFLKTFDLKIEKLDKKLIELPTTNEKEILQILKQYKRENPCKFVFNPLDMNEKIPKVEKTIKVQKEKTDRKQYFKTYQDIKKEKLRAYEREYYAINKEKKLQYMRERYLKNKAKLQK